MKKLYHINYLMNRNLEKLIEDFFEDALDFLKENINWKITEHDLLQFIRGKLQEKNIELSEKNTVLFNPKNNEYDHIVDPEKSNVIRKKGSLYIRIVYQNPPSFDETTIEKKFSLNL